MEFNVSEFAIVGCVQKKIREYHAKIKVLGYLDELQNFQRFSEEEAIAYFPPSGYVFEPGFFRNYPFSEGDFISFYVEENQRADIDNGDYVFKIEYKCPDVNKLGNRYYTLPEYNIKDNTLDLEELSINENLEDGVFYGITKQHIIGPFSFENGVISAKNSSTVEVWELNTENILSCENYSCLFSIPKSSLCILDCLNYKELFDWFKMQLRNKSGKYLDYLDRETSWRKDLLASFANVGEEVKKINTIRYNRLIRMIDLIELDNHAVKDIIDISPNFEEIFVREIERHKSEYIQKEIEKGNSELFDFKNRIEAEKAEIDKQFDDYQTKIETSEKILKKKSDELEQLNQSISELTERKEEIIQDFHIIKEVLGGTKNSSNNHLMENENYVLSEICRKKDSVPQQPEDTIGEIACYLNEYEINHKYANRIYNCVMNKQATLIGDLKIGLAVAKASHNACFLVQPVDPDWLHFEDLWNHGLAKMWYAAHEDKDKLYLLILQDVNMSSPECYLRPINNIVSGLTDTLPMSHLGFPSNLRILATIAPSEEPEIGLPINKNTFKEWGAVGFKNLTNGESNRLEKGDKNTFLQSFTTELDEYDKLTLLSDIERELDEIVND